MLLKSSSSASADSAATITKLRTIQLEKQYMNLRLTLSGQLINACVLAWVLYGHAPAWQIFTWLASIFLITLVRGWIGFMFHKKRSHYPDSTWKRILMTGIFVSGAVWGIMPITFLHVLPELYQAFLLSLFGGTLAGGTVFFAPLFSAFVTFMLPHVISIEFSLLMLSESHSVYLAMFAVVALFSLMILQVAWQTSQEFIRHARTFLNNTDLVAKLDESEQLFRTLTENSPSAVLLVCDNRFIYLNEAATEITGYTLDELIGRNFWEIVHPDDRQELMDRATLRVATDGPATLPGRYDFKIVHRDGTARWIDFAPARVEYHGRPAILGSCMDITRQREDQEARQESEQQYRILFDTANDAMFVVGLDKSGQPAQFLDVNTQACVKLDYKRDELLHMRPADITYQHEKGYPDKYHHRLLNEGRAVFEVRHITRSGEHFSVEVSAQLFSFRGARSLLFIARDISERKENEIKLRTAMEQAEAASKAKSEFLANMSHEIRTPLNGVLGMLQLLRLSEQDRENSQYLETAISSGESLLSIINDILDLSKIEAGKFEITNAPMDVHDLVTGIRDIFEIPARNKGLDIEVVIAPDVPHYIISDLARIRQILYNLVGNAVKFTVEGSISIHVSMASRSGNRGTMELRIRDTGIGIPENLQADLFEPFVQVTGTQQRRGSGTGLGLSIVKRIAAHMGGSVMLSSSQGQGTTVTVSLDICIADNATRPLKPAPGPFCTVPERRLHILVAEDNPVNQLMITKTLEKLGHTSECAHDGQEAVDMLGTVKFDCVLMDIQMPVMDGLEATRVIRSGALPDTDPNIPIIALTAYALTEDRDKFIGQGMSGYLAKPVSIEALSAMLGKIRYESESI